MKKVLFVATVVKGHIDVFHLPYLKMFKDNGWETTVIAKNNYENKSDCIIPFCDNFIDLPFERNPFKFNNIKCYVKLKEILKNEKFDIVHCHTPVGGVITRLATKKNDNNQIIYTAHGFHFFEGAPTLNWLLFYPIEKFLAKRTDLLITMNDEDFEVVNKKFMTSKSVLIPGIGVDLKKFKKNEKVENDKLRIEKGFNESQFILISVGELSKRKNQIQLLKVANKLKDRIENLKILIVGTGDAEPQLKEFVKKQSLGHIVEFLGYRTDISELMNISDVVISTSKQEGLPVNLIEALAVGKPIIATNCRGNRDLVFNNVNGYVSEISDIDSMAENILKIYNNSEKQLFFSEQSLKKSVNYDIANVLKIMKSIYEL